MAEMTFPQELSDSLINMNQSLSEVEKNTKQTVSSKNKADTKEKIQKTEKTEAAPEFSSAFKPLQKTISDSAVKFKEFMEPGSLIKSVGLGLNSPAIIFLGEKMSGLGKYAKKQYDEYKQTNAKQQAEANKANEKIINAMKKNGKSEEEIASTLALAEKTRKTGNIWQEQKDEQTLNALKTIAENSGLQAEALEDLIKAGSKDKKGFFDSILPKEVLLFGTAIAGFLGGTLAEFGSSISKVVKPFKSVFKGIFGKSGFITKIFTKISSLFGKLVEKFSKLAGKAGIFGKFGRILGRLAMPLMIGYELIKGFIEGETIKDKIFNMISGVMSIFTEPIQWVSNFMLTLFGSDFKLDFSAEAIKETMMTGFDSVMNFFTETLPNAFNTFFDFIKSIPKKIVEGLKNTTKKIASGIKKVFSFIGLGSDEEEPKPAPKPAPVIEPKAAPKPKKSTLEIKDFKNEDDFWKAAYEEDVANSGLTTEEYDAQQNAITVRKREEYKARERRRKKKVDLKALAKKSKEIRDLRASGMTTEELQNKFPDNPVVKRMVKTQQELTKQKTSVPEKSNASNNVISNQQINNTTVYPEDMTTSLQGNELSNIDW